MTSEPDNATLNDAGQKHIYAWETDDLPLLRKLMSRPPNMTQRRMQIIRKVYAFFQEI